MPATATFSDPTNEFTAQASGIIANAIYAFSLWEAYLAPSTGSISISITIDPELETANGGAETSVFAETRGDIDIFRSGAAYEWLTGIDPNGSTADIIIHIGASALRDVYWIDPLDGTPRPSNRFDLVDILAHEIAHGLAFNGWKDDTTYLLPDDYESPFDYYMSVQSTYPYFTGPNAQAVYGGPVPLTAGNPFHLGNNSPAPGQALLADLMNGVTFSFSRYFISALDVAMVSDTGVPTILSDTLLGGNQADTINAGSGNDTITGGLGSDTIVGGAGIDRAVFAGSRASYTITRTGAGSATVASGLDGTDTVSSVERLRFADQTVAIGTAAPQDNNGDGKSDILWRHSDGTLLLWQMNGRTISTENMVARVGAAWSIAGLGDFNSDGNSDILWRNTDGTILLWQMNGKTISAEGSLGRIGASWNITGIGDFNGDGNSDILWRNTDGTVLIWRMNGRTIAGETSLGQIGAAWSAVGKGDFNADGNTDILWRNTDGSLLLWQMNGTAIGSERSLGRIGAAWSIAATNDFDGDGFSDILWRNTDGSVLMWRMNETSIASEAGLGTIGASWNISGAGDYNGDGKADILWRNSDGSNLLWTMNGTQLASEGSVSTVGNSWTLAPSGGVLAMVA